MENNGIEIKWDQDTRTPYDYIRLARDRTHDQRSAVILNTWS